MDKQIPLVRGDRIDSDVSYRGQLLQNAMSVNQQVLDMAGYVTTYPGYEVFSDAAGNDRNGVYNERMEKHFRVSGDSFIEVGPNGDYVDLGPISGNGGLYSTASLPFSFNTQAIITGQKMWLYNGTDLTEIVDPDLLGVIDGCWIDGYYFLTDGEFLYHTDITDEYSISPEKFATAEFSPDPTIAVAKTQDNEVMVFGRYTTEFFFNDASTGFAFARVGGKATRAGIIGKNCKVEMSGVWYCLGGSKEEEPTMLIIGAGGTANFSNRAVDEILSTYSELELRLATMQTLTYDRQELIKVTLGFHTLLYNHTMAQAMGTDLAWSILTRGTQQKPTALFNEVYDPRIDKWVGGHRTDPVLLAQTIESAAQEGEPSEAIFTTPFTYLENMSVDELDVQSIPGQNIGEVRVFISVTEDGVTFGKEWEVTYSEGKGDYMKRLIVRRLGYVRNWVAYRLRVVSPNKVALCNLVLRYG